jgi:hypothetical protein
VITSFMMIVSLCQPAGAVPAASPTAAAERGVSIPAEPDGRDQRRKPKPQPVIPGPLGSPLVPPGLALPPLTASGALALAAAGGLVPPAGGAAASPPPAAAGTGAAAAAGAGAAAGAAAAPKPTLRLRFTAGRPSDDDTDVRIDGRRWAPKAWDAPRNVSAGRHRLSVDTEDGGHFEHIADASNGEVVIDIPAVGGSKPGPIPLGVWLALGGTGVVAITTTIFGFVALDKTDTYHAANGKPGRTRKELTTLRDDAARWELLTDVGLGLSVAGAGATVALYFLLDRDDRPAAAFSPLPGGGLFVLGGSL